MSHIEIPIERLPVDRPVRLDDGAGGVVVIRTASGEVWAFRDLCPHARWRLSQGDVVEGRLECPGHGMQFDLGTGRCVDVDTYRLEPVGVARRGPTVAIAVGDDPEVAGGAP
jgi:nitrite reductase/ring-hydroxylating ferredoxin subunit